LLPEDAEVARTEAARRLLRQQAQPATQVAQSRKLSVAAALFAIVDYPAIAAGFYLYLGNAQLEDMPLAARLTTRCRILRISQELLRVLNDI